MPVPVVKKRAQIKVPTALKGPSGPPVQRGVIPPIKGAPPTTTTPIPAPTIPTYGAAPPTAQGQSLRSDADKAMMGANTDYRDSVYRAVMGLGDPTQIAKYQQNPAFAGYNFVVDPNSAFSQLDEGQRLGIKGVDDNAVQGNTFFSGLRQNNQDDVRQNFLFQKSGATNSFQEALAAYARSLAAAQGAKTTAYTQADTVDFNAANAIEPNPAAAAEPLSPSMTAAQFAAAQKKKAKKK